MLLDLGWELEEALRILTLALLASVKFLPAPFLAEIEHFSFIEAFLITTTGGIIGVIAFVFIGEGIKAFWRHFVAMIKSIFSKKTVSQLEKKDPKKFTVGNRRLVSIKQKFGLAGIAFVTPCIISIPIGCLVAVHFYRSRKKVLTYILTSLLLWSLVLNWLAQVTDLSSLFAH